MKKRRVSKEKRNIENSMADHRRESGVALLLAMVFLFLLSMMGLSSLDSAMTDARVVGATKSSEASLAMADAGVADALDLLYNRYNPVNTPNVGETINVSKYGGLSGSFAAQGQHETRAGTYGLAPSTQIQLVGIAENCMGLSNWRLGVWDITVEGVGPNGRSKSRVHFSATKCQCVTGNCE